jgi:hypothetical protein
VRQGGDSIPAAEVRERIEAIMTSDEFVDEPSMLEEFIDWLADSFDLPGAPAGVVDSIPWIFLGLLASVLLYLVVRVIVIAVRHSRSGSGVGERSPGPTARERASDLRRQARAARADGDLRLALRLDLFALMVGLGARGNLRYRDAWTNRELLRRGEPARATFQLLSPLVEELEAKDFGSEPTTLDDLDRLEALCDEHLGALEGDER